MSEEWMAPAAPLKGTGSHCSSLFISFKMLEKLLEHLSFKMLISKWCDLVPFKNLTSTCLCPWVPNTTLWWQQRQWWFRAGLLQHPEMRAAKGFEKARRAKLGVNTLPEWAALLVNSTIGFWKEKEVERSRAESFPLLHWCSSSNLVNIYIIFRFEKTHLCL